MLTRYVHIGLKLKTMMKHECAKNYDLYFLMYNMWNILCRVSRGFSIASRTRVAFSNYLNVRVGWCCVISVTRRRSKVNLISTFLLTSKHTYNTLLSPKPTEVHMNYQTIPNKNPQITKTPRTCHTERSKLINYLWGLLTLRVYGGLPLRNDGREKKDNQSRK